MLYAKKKRRKTKAKSKTKKPKRKKIAKKRPRAIKRLISKKKKSLYKVKPKLKKKVLGKRAKVKSKVKSQKKSVVTLNDEMLLGRVTHYFPNVKVGAILIEKGTLKVGDIVQIKGYTTNFKQKIKSLQIERVSIHQGQVGDEVGILVKSRVRIHDIVYMVKR